VATHATVVATGRSTVATHAAVVTIHPAVVATRAGRSRAQSEAYLAPRWPPESAARAFPGHLNVCPAPSAQRRTANQSLTSSNDHSFGHLRSQDDVRWPRTLITPRVEGFDGFDRMAQKPPDVPASIQLREPAHPTGRKVPPAVAGPPPPLPLPTADRPHNRPIRAPRGDPRAPEPRKGPTARPAPPPGRAGTRRPQWQSAAAGPWRAGTR